MEVNETNRPLTEVQADNTPETLLKQLKNRRMLLSKPRKKS